MIIDLVAMTNGSRFMCNCCKKYVVGEVKSLRGILWFRLPDVSDFPTNQIHVIQTKRP